MAFHLYKRGSVTGTIAQNVAFFSPVLQADLRALFNGIWSVAITPTTNSSVEYSTDNGVTFFPILSMALPANVETICNFVAQSGDQFQLRCPDVAGITLHRCIVSIAPQDLQRRGGDVPVINGSVSPLEIKDVSVLKDDISSLARAIDQEWFASDITPSVLAGFSSNLLLTFCYTARAIFEISLDSGATWCQLDGGNDIDEDTINNFFIPVINGDLVNFRADTAGTVQYARVTETGA